MSKTTTKAMKGTALLIVDPQLDFHEGGSLAVPGANADAERIAELISEKQDQIDEIFVTLDSHHVSLVGGRFGLLGLVKPWVLVFCLCVYAFVCWQVRWWRCEVLQNTVTLSL